MDTISWVRRDTASSLFVEQYAALTYRQQTMAISSPSRRNARDAIGTLLLFPRKNGALHGSADLISVV
jgi:hypothetical protein